MLYNSRRRLKIQKDSLHLTPTALWLCIEKWEPDECLGCTWATLEAPKNKGQITPKKSLTLLARNL